jgi:hypothetical protein
VHARIDLAFFTCAAPSRVIITLPISLVQHPGGYSKETQTSDTACPLFPVYTARARAQSTRRGVCEQETLMC